MLRPAILVTVTLLVSLAASQHEASSETWHEDFVVPESVDLLAVRVATVSEIVERHFGALDGGNTFPGANKVSAPFQLCRKPGVTLDQILVDLGIDKYCNKDTGSAKDNQSCLAIQAAKGAFDELGKAFPEGPAFKNYLVVDWEPSASNLTPTCEAGTLGKLNVPVDGKPPKAEFLPGKGNGCNSFGLCNIIVTTLMHANDQSSTGTCGPQAMFAAVALARPARAIKIATELLWSGTYHQFEQTACPAIQGYQPGLVPYKHGNVGCGCRGSKCHGVNTAGAKCGEKVCTGNENDCTVADGGPYQMPGLSFMISQAFLSSIYHSVSGKCDKQQDGLGLMYGALGDSKSAKDLGGAQGTMAGHLIFMCKGLIGLGVHCTYLKNKQCSSPTHCDQWYEQSPLSKMTPAQIHSIEDAMKTGIISGLDQSTRKLRQDLMAAVGGQDQMKEFVKYLKTPNFTPDLLTQACASLPAVAMVDARVLLNNFHVPDNAECDHWITLSKCDVANDQYTMWSWGTTYIFKKEYIVGVGPNNAAGFSNRGSVCNMIAVPPNTGVAGSVDVGPIKFRS